ncbi:2-phosphosulfolactate phosphatase [Rubrobacter taiwanensis]|uniref:2-phosphosulfolactate phosphatase n=1 Tax=Rubrobacter taiwanensis TaxID=185139 RepID=UPI001404AFDA|nr:2-phosphosulfolactate phosphatase [Rubrobacter taiwanensis]
MLARFAAGAAGARAAARSGAAVAVVDAFRASTSICVLASRGVRVVPVASLEQAARAEADYRIGERGSVRVAGFDFGNSPTELITADLRPGATAVLSTTNGTRVLNAADGAPVLLTGAFVNATALAGELLCHGPEVAVVGCGWKGKRALEDEMAAGAILHRLCERGVRLDGRARRAAEMYRARPKSDVLRASAARRLKRLGHAADLTLCLEEDTLPVVPRLVDGVFEPLRRGTGEIGCR